MAKGRVSCRDVGKTDSVALWVVNPCLERSGPAFLNTERGLDKWIPASFRPPSRGAAVQAI